MPERAERGVTLFEISLVVLIAGLLIAAVAGGRAVANMARKSAVPRQVNGVIAAFQAYVEDRGGLPGDRLADGGNGNGVIQPDEPALDAMVRQGFLDGASVDDTTAPKTVSLPMGMRGQIVTVTGDGGTIPWPFGERVHVLRINFGNDAATANDIEEVLDDGAADLPNTPDSTGNVRSSPDLPWLLYIALDRR